MGHRTAETAVEGSKSPTGRLFLPIIIINYTITIIIIIIIMNIITTSTTTIII